MLRTGQAMTMILQTRFYFLISHLQEKFKSIFSKGDWKDHRCVVCLTKEETFKNQETGVKWLNMNLTALNTFQRKLVCRK